MAKKRIISLILLCAFTVIFVHGIIPHHHHEEATALHHFGSHDDDHDDFDNTFLGRAFSHFQHGAGSIIYEAASPIFQYSKSNIDKEAILYTQYVLRQLYKPPIVHRERSPFVFILSYFSAIDLLRGPPVA